MHEVENMFSVNEVPWHKLGTILPQAPATVEEALVLAGLDWDVAACPMHTRFEGEELPTKSQAIIRKTDKRILGEVGNGYHPVQNKDAFKFFNPALEKGLVTIETAGSLCEGSKVWMLGRVVDTTHEVVPGDEVNGYFLLSNSHDGSLTVRAGFTSIRVVCSNTLSLAQQGKKARMLRVRHTKNAEIGLEKIQEVIDWNRQTFAGTVEKMRELAKFGVRADTLREYVERVFQPEVKQRVVCEEDEKAALDKIYNKVVPLFEKGRGNDMPKVKGTMWAAYNAVSEYLTWERGHNPSTRLNSLWFGQAANTNQRAFDQALKIAA